MWLWLQIASGLSNCTPIKELYLAGNKISDIEGLHRLLKLTVLDLSFNKITTTKALGQLVANYNSLLALNLLGNPIQSNISDDQLRKTVCSLLPKLAFLNKQPINAQKAREVGTEAVAKAALGSSSRGTHRRATRKVGTGASSSASVHRSSASVAQKSRHRLRSRTQHQSSKAKWSALGIIAFLNCFILVDSAIRKTMVLLGQCNSRKLGVQCVSILFIYFYFVLQKRGVIKIFVLNCEGSSSISIVLWKSVWNSATCGFRCLSFYDCLN